MTVYDLASLSANDMVVGLVGHWALKMVQLSVDLTEFHKAEGKEKIQVRKSACLQEEKMEMESDESMVAMMVMNYAATLAYLKVLLMGQQSDTYEVVSLVADLAVSMVDVMVFDKGSELAAEMVFCVAVEMEPM